MFFYFEGDVATEVQADHSQLVLILVCGSIVMLVVIILIFVMGRLVCRFREKAMEEKTKTSQSTDLDDSSKFDSGWCSVCWTF